MSSNGAAKNDKEKMDLSLIPKVALEAAAHAFMVGEKKYGRYNFYKGHQASQLVAAMMRHATAWMEGEERDPVDGQLHLGSVIATAAMLLQQQKLGTLKDNRYKGDTEHSSTVFNVSKKNIEIKIGISFHEKHTENGLWTVAKQDGKIISAKDDLTGITWFALDDEKTYTFDEAVAKYGDKLPTKEEFEEAESHGIREVMSDFKCKWFWSSSVISTNRNLSWVFGGTYGNVSSNYRSNNLWARCVGR